MNGWMDGWMDGWSVSGRRATNAFLKRLKSTPSAPSLISLRFSLSLSPQPQSDAPLPESSGYLQVFLDGGLNQQRISVCNAVAVARLLNATLLVPEFATNIFWQDSSQFADIFDLPHFIASLQGDVRIVRSLPRHLAWSTAAYYASSLSRRNKLVRSAPLHATKKWYLKRVLPRLKQRGIVAITPFSHRLAFTGLPREIQRLRCRVNFHALRFVQPIRELGQKLVQRMQDPSLRPTRRGAPHSLSHSMRATEMGEGGGERSGREEGRGEWDEGLEGSWRVAQSLSVDTSAIEVVGGRREGGAREEGEGDWDEGAEMSLGVAQSLSVEGGESGSAAELGDGGSGGGGSEEGGGREEGKGSEKGGGKEDGGGREEGGREGEEGWVELVGDGGKGGDSGGAGEGKEGGNISVRESDEGRRIRVELVGNGGEGVDMGGKGEEEREEGIEELGGERVAEEVGKEGSWEGLEELLWWEAREKGLEHGEQGNGRDHGSVEEGREGEKALQEREGVGRNSSSWWEGELERDAGKEGNGRLAYKGSDFSRDFEGKEDAWSGGAERESVRIERGSNGDGASERGLLGGYRRRRLPERVVGGDVRGNDEAAGNDVGGEEAGGEEVGADEVRGGIAWVGDQVEGLVLEGPRREGGEEGREGGSLRWEAVKSRVREVRDLRLRIEQRVRARLEQWAEGMRLARIGAMWGEWKHLERMRGERGEGSEGAKGKEVRDGKERREGRGWKDEARKAVGEDVRGLLWGLKGMRKVIGAATKGLRWRKGRDGELNGRRVGKQEAVEGGQKRKRFLAMHLRFDLDMVAHSRCDYGEAREEREQLRQYWERAWGVGREGNVQHTPQQLRVAGKCPLTPEEAGLVLAALGFSRHTRLYVASYQVYGGPSRMAALLRLFPNLEDKTTLATPEELRPFRGRASMLAALDFYVSMHSDVFVSTSAGNMHNVMVRACMVL
ncbi:unnamed protein product [Closterium sp. NIES-53]